jgi:hypothetical protein
MWRREGGGSKSKSYRCPSWSWASQDSAIGYKLASGRHPAKHFPGRDLLKLSQPSYDDLFMPKILNVSVEVDRINAFGDVKEGYIELDIVITTGWVLKDHFRPGPNWESKRALLMSFADCDESWQATAFMDDSVCCSQQGTCAFVGYHCASLVLLLLYPLVLNAKSYERTGIAIFEHTQLMNPKGRSMSGVLDLMLRRTINVL